jgi:hypothetical protein
MDGGVERAEGELLDGGLPSGDADDSGTRSDFGRLITERARGVIDAYLETRDRVDWGRSIKSMTEHTAHEYGGRFLLELLQNAYDAHPRESRDGRICVRLDETAGDHGVLYMANGGNGFTESNFRALCNLGLSDKPVGEGIGNKGVGFKSVLQICEAPEIYSSDPADITQAGFSFRFARPDDIPGLVDADAAKSEQVLADVSLYTVPVPLEVSDTYVAELRDHGFATVLRLPLRSTIALAETRKQLQELAGNNIPVLLFLRRIDRLTIEHVCDEDSSRRELRREATALGCESAEAQRVRLTEGGEFFVFSRDVDPDELHGAISQAVEAELLDRRWLEWKAPASISVAVAASHEISEFRSYTYLPMGPKAPAPFAGHLNAPFFTKLARLDLDPSHPLNSMLLGACAKLALTAAQTLSSGVETGWERAVADLMSWNADAIHHLAAVRDLDGVQVGDRMLLPTGQPSNPLTSMADGWRWPLPDAGILTADLANRTAGMSPIWDGLGDARLGRLSETMSALGLELDPAPEALAAWAEKMAAHCMRADLPLSGWDLFYNDIARMFKNKAEVLTGRRLLLSDERELMPCSGPRSSKESRRQATPFFPPVRQRIEDEDLVETDADLGLPSDVKKRIFYLHPSLSWHDENREQTPARAFFQDHHLVRRFDARSLLEHLRSILTNSHNKRLHSESLRFVYNLSRPKAPRGVNLNELGLRVPNMEGEWIPAETALFSHEWPGTHGEDLSLLAAAPYELAPDLAGLTRRMLAHPSQLLRSKEAKEQWLEFLRDVGVQDGLPVLGTADKRKLYGRHLGRGELIMTAGLPTDVVLSWEPILRPDYQARHRETEYVATSPVYWLPGQTVIKELSHRHREAYARLVILGLSQWPDEYLRTSWERDRTGNKDQQLIPTPLAAFLRATEWLPVHDPGQRTNRFSKAADAWFFPLRNSDAPRFSPLITAAMRDAINDNKVILRRLKDIGVGIWTDPQHAYRLIAFLGEQFAADGLDSPHLSQFQQTYLAAWTQISALFSPSLDGLRHLVVEMDGHLQAVEVKDLRNHAPVAVADKSDDPFATRLIREFGQPLLQLADSAPKVAPMLAQRFDDRITQLADMKLSPVLGGQIFTPTGGAIALLDEVPWLRATFAVVLEHRWPNPTPLSERVFQLAIDRLSHVGLVRANTISVRVGNQDRALPRKMRGILPIPDPHHPTLAIQGTTTQSDWSLLEAIPEALLQLVGHRALAAEFALVIHKLRSMHVDFQAGPATATLAEACDIDVRAVEQTLQRIDSALVPLLERLFPIVHLWAGAKAAQPLFPQGDDIRNEEDLLSVLAEMADLLPVSAADVVAAARSVSSLDELRKKLGIALSDLNAALNHIHPQYPPIDYSEHHAEEFDWYVRSKWKDISERVRWALLPAFRAKQPIIRWIEIREPKSLAPDPVWNHTLDHLSEDLLKQRIEQRLTALLGDSAPTQGPALPAMASVHEANVRLGESEYSPTARNVRAWYAKNGIEPPAAWADVTDSRPVLQRLDEVGALDFEPLDTRQMLEWLKTAGLWPSGMPLSADPKEAGLSVQDLERAESDEHRARLERQRARQTVTINGEPVNVGDGYRDLRQRIEASLNNDRNIMKTPIRFAKLEELDSPAARGGNEVRLKVPTASARPRASQSQLEAIGFAGELVAYRWLVNRYKDRFTDDCWVSTNRASCMTGSAGDDGCGYDFLIPSRGGALMYEVKATTGGAGEFQLGESEVRQAQMHARNDRWRILIVTHVLTDERELLVLHNPFSPRSRGHYVFAGEGLRIRYNPSR